MRRFFCSALTLILGMAGWAVAQNGNGPPGDPKDGPPPGGPEKGPPPGGPGEGPAPAPGEDGNGGTSKEGDIIELTTGKQLTGVQVIRKTPTVLEIEVLPELEPLRIPRGQVVDIQYDNIDPRKRQREADRQEEEGAKPDVLVGQKLSNELYERITAPVGDAPITRQNKDYVQVLRQLSQQAGIPLEIAPPVQQIPPRQRLWTVTVEPGVSFLAVLREKLLKDFPDLKLVYEYEKIILTTKAANQPTPPRPRD